MDLNAGLITVRETQPDDDADSDDPKSEAGQRTIALSAMLVTLLRAWRKRQLKERMAWGEAWQDSRFGVHPRGWHAAAGPAASPSTSGYSSAGEACRPSGSTT